MPSAPDTAWQTLDRLARRVAELETLVGQLEARAAQPGERRNPRLAITAANPGTGLYPSAPSGDEELAGYWIRFVDASFPKVQGVGTPTIVGRQSAGNEFAFASNLVPGPCSYPEEGTLILVTADRTDEGHRNWWFVYSRDGDCES